MRKPICLLLLTSFSVLSVLLAAGPRQPEGDWKAVQEAINKRRPQTAIQRLEPIIRTTMQRGDYDEAIRAVAMKIMLESTIEGGKAEERITRLEDTMQDLPEPMQPMMEVILANWYWGYFQQNQWRFVQRTQTDQPSGDDILSWDLPRILAEIDKHFEAALKGAKQLQETPVSQFDELLTKGSMPDTHRPTLFDFVVYDALRFYSSGEQAGATAQDAYVLQASSPVLGPLQDFLAWEIESSDTQSPTLKAIRLYQRLMTFHQAKGNDAALAEADLHRLEFGYNQSFGEEKDARYKAALARFAKRWQDAPISARALAAHTQVLRGEQRLVEAHQLAEQGWKAFPSSVGGKLCYNLLQEIEAKEINVSVERVWNNPWPSIQVHYRNLTRVHLRAVRYDWQSLIERVNYHPGSIDARLRNELVQRKPDLQWSHDLPPTEDYLAQDAVFEVPDKLDPGYYFLLPARTRGSARTTTASWLRSSGSAR